MTLYSLLGLIGGLALFLFGMNQLSSGLEKVAGGRLEGTLRMLTSNRFKALALGTVITAAIQSSSALTVMLVGLVNSGIMELSQTVGVIMGSNIGTTMTAWILSMSGIESDNIIISMAKPENFSPIIAIIGVIFILASKKQSKKDIGGILVAFAILMYGMDMMSDAVSPLAQSDKFTSIMTAFDNPFLGILFGAGFTAIIQSSSASVGILQALAMTGSISFGAAIPIIMGQNIGTCVTSVISSIGVNKNAKRVAVVHISFNLIGTTVCMCIYFIVKDFLDPKLMASAITPVGIAIFHSIFNIFTTAILLPFSNGLVKIARFVIKDDAEDKTVLLDSRLLNSPAFAVQQARNYVVEMSELARDSFTDALRIFSNFNEKAADLIIKKEQRLDYLEDELGTFLIQLSSKETTEADSNQITEMLHCISDFERIGDHAINLMTDAREMHAKRLSFSPAAQKEFIVLKAALTEILSNTSRCYQADDAEQAALIEPLEEVIDDLTSEIKDRHILRIKSGVCASGLSVIIPNMVTNCERVSDHCSNVAVCIIQTKESAFDKHIFLNEMKYTNNEEFLRDFKAYSAKYHLDEDISGHIDYDSQYAGSHEQAPQTTD